MLVTIASSQMIKEFVPGKDEGNQETSQEARKESQLRQLVKKHIWNQKKLTRGQT